MPQIIIQARTPAETTQLLRQAQEVIDEVKPPASMIHAAYLEAVRLLAGTPFLLQDSPAAPAPFVLPGLAGKSGR